MMLKLGDWVRILNASVLDVSKIAIIVRKVGVPRAKNDVI